MPIALFTAIVIIIADQSLKYWITQSIPINEIRDFIPGILNLSYVRNYGAGWGILPGKSWIFIIITSVIILYLGYLIWKHRQYPLYVHMIYGLLLGGAIGNFIDRLRVGYVIDMFHLDFISFPVFNIADSALTVGCILMVFLLLFDQSGREFL